MSGSNVPAQLFISPGYACIPGEPTSLRAVAASTIVVTAFHPTKNIGGMCHYSHPIRDKKKSSPKFAAPALFSFIKRFEEKRIKIRELEFCIYGGAEWKKAPRYERNFSQKNIETGREILEKLGARNLSLETGGSYARKIVFNSWNGEAMIAKVSNVRDTDWYPTINCKGRTS